MRLRGGQPDFSDAFADAARLARGRSSSQLARAAIGYAGFYYEAGVVDQTLIDLLREACWLSTGEEQDLHVRVLARLAEVLHFAGEELPVDGGRRPRPWTSRATWATTACSTAALAGRPRLAPARPRTSPTGWP